MLRVLTAAIVAMMFASSASAQVAVRGYTRSDGTFVAPHVRSSPNASTFDNYGSNNRASSSTYTAPAPLYASPTASAQCSGFNCYGQPSSTTGAPLNNRVSGYTRSDGTYVAPYYRSSPRR